jgi:hypothetical protein
MRIKYFVFLAILLVAVFGFSGSAKALTVQELQTQIQALMQQIAQLQEQLKQMQGTGSEAKWCYNFTKNLRIEDNGDGVYALQVALNRSGVPTVTEKSAYFDEILASAVSEFQEKYADEILKPNGLRKGNGYVGPATRKKLNALYGCSVACTMDAKQCPDGSYVSRKGPKCEFAKCPEIETQCKVDADCPQIACIVGPCPINKCINGKCVLTNVTVKEQVKCIFENNTSSSLQKCYTAENNSRAFCSGIETCVADISGNKGEKITWKSSCGGYAYTTIDGESEYATFNCSSTQPSITVTSPNGGETWKVGETKNITWQTSNISSPNDKITLYVALANNLGMHCNIAQKIPNTGSYNFTVGDPSTYCGSAINNISYRVGGQFKILACAGSALGYNNCDVVQDYSDNYFTITSGTAITCTDSDNSDSIDTYTQGADIFISGSVVYTNHTNLTPSNGTLTDACRGSSILAEYRCHNNFEDMNLVTCPNGCENGACKRESTQPSITVTSPNGGEVWKVGETHNITWTSSNLNTVDINLFGNQTSKYPVNYRIATNISTSNGTYLWTIPSQTELISLGIAVGGSYKISISGRVSPTTEYLIDASDNYFTITSSAKCIAEGGSIPVIFNPPSCCSGLTLIKPMSSNLVGSSGICTSKCGNGICDSSTETNYNCPKDCLTTCTENGKTVYMSSIFGPTQCCSKNAGIKPSAVLSGDYCVAPSDGSLGTCIDNWWQTCGDGICSKDEDKCNCSKDCLSIQTSITASTSQAQYISGREKVSISYDVANAPTGAVIEMDIKASKMFGGVYRLVSPYILDGTTRTFDLSVAQTTFPSHGTITWTPSIYEGFLPIEGPLEIRIKSSSNALLTSIQVPIKIVSATIQPSISVVSPNGGETYRFGDTLNVRWGSGDVNKVHINLTNVSTNYTLNIAENYSASTGYFNWTISSNLSRLIAGNQYKITIWDADAGFTGVNDVSDNYFTISSATTQPSITVISPNGGETYQVGNRLDVKWNSQGLSQYDLINIFLIKSDVATHPVLVDPPLIDESEINHVVAVWSTTNTGEYSYIGNYEPGNYKIKVVDRSGGTIKASDKSDNYFTITAQ